MKLNARLKGFFLLVIALSCLHRASAQQMAACIPAKYNVSPTGAFTFNVHIDLPPGLRGIMPKLSIDYNSQGTSGILGIGWSISGLSSISRALPTIRHNRFMGPIDFNSDDVFIIDGQRLF